MKVNQDVMEKISGMSDMSDESNTSIKYIDTRFGRIRIDTSKSILFANGLLGMENLKDYCISNFPNQKFERFKILQSMTDLKVSFIVLPYVTGDNYSYLYENEDIEKLAEELQLDSSNMVILLITSVHRDSVSGKADISVNVRAPIVVNTATNCAIQYVFMNDKYKIAEAIIIETSQKG